jgi:CheY-like chemotaxis protein
MADPEKERAYCPACGGEGPTERIADDAQERVQCATCGLVLDVAEARPYEPIGDILFADDSDLLRLAIEDMLLEKKLARSVIPTPNGQDFLKVFAQRLREGSPVDLVMLDVQMPVLDGFHAAIAMRGVEQAFELQPPTPLMFFSSQPCDGQAKDVLRACGRAIYVNKVASPNLAELASRVEQVLINLITKGQH